MPDATGEQQITDILRRQYETGAYGNAHFRFTATTKLRLERLFRGPDTTPLPVDPMLRVVAIPVVVDDGMRDGTWELVDNSTREVLHAGNLDSLETGDA